MCLRIALLFLVFGGRRSGDDGGVRNRPLFQYQSPEIRKSAAVDCLRYRCLIAEIVQVLQQVQPKHDFQRVRFVAALSFVVARLNQLKPFLPQDNPFDLREKFFFSSSVPVPVHR